MSCKITAICIATKTAKCLPVLIKSIESYVPSSVEIYLAINEPHIDYHSRKHSLHLMKNTGKTFGESYNLVMQEAFKDHDLIMVCNDDVVFTPQTFDRMQKDYEQLSNMLAENISKHINTKLELGWVGARTDYAAGWQNIRASKSREIVGLKFAEENCIEHTDFIAPICAVISRKAYVPYENLNYYSDDINCKQMEMKGCLHFISTAYVHHVGSQTIGDNGIELAKESLQYIQTRSHLKDLIDTGGYNAIQ